MSTSVPLDRILGTPIDELEHLLDKLHGNPHPMLVSVLKHLKEGKASKHLCIYALLLLSDPSCAKALEPFNVGDVDRVVVEESVAAFKMRQVWHVAAMDVSRRRCSLCSVAEPRNTYVPYCEDLDERGTYAWTCERCGHAEGSSEGKDGVAVVRVCRLMQMLFKRSPDRKGEAHGTAPQASLSSTITSFFSMGRKSNDPEPPAPGAHAVDVVSWCPVPFNDNSPAGDLLALLHDVTHLIWRPHQRLRKGDKATLKEHFKGFNACAADLRSQVLLLSGWEEIPHEWDDDVERLFSLVVSLRLRTLRRMKLSDCSPFLGGNVPPTLATPQFEPISALLKGNQTYAQRMRLYKLYAAVGEHRVVSQRDAFVEASSRFSRAADAIEQRARTHDQMLQERQAPVSQDDPFLLLSKGQGAAAPGRIYVDSSAAGPVVVDTHTPVKLQGAEVVRFRHIGIRLDGSFTFLRKSESTSDGEWSQLLPDDTWIMSWQPELREDSYTWDEIMLSVTPDHKSVAEVYFGLNDELFHFNLRSWQPEGISTQGLWSSILRPKNHVAKMTNDRGSYICASLVLQTRCVELPKEHPDHVVIRARFESLCDHRFAEPVNVIASCLTFDATPLGASTLYFSGPALRRQIDSQRVATSAPKQPARTLTETTHAALGEKLWDTGEGERSRVEAGDVFKLLLKSYPTDTTGYVGAVVSGPGPSTHFAYARPMLDNLGLPCHILRVERHNFHSILRSLELFRGPTTSFVFVQVTGLLEGSHLIKLVEKARLSNVRLLLLHSEQLAALLRMTGQDRRLFWPPSFASERNNPIAFAEVASASRDLERAESVDAHPLHALYNVTSSPSFLQEFADQHVDMRDTMLANVCQRLRWRQAEKEWRAEAPDTNVFALIIAAEMESVRQHYCKESQTVALMDAVDSNFETSLKADISNKIDPSNTASDAPVDGSGGDHRHYCFVVLNAHILSRIQKEIVVNQIARTVPLRKRLVCRLVFVMPTYEPSDLEIPVTTKKALGTVGISSLKVDKIWHALSPAMEHFPASKASQLEYRAMRMVLGPLVNRMDVPLPEGDDGIGRVVERIHTSEHSIDEASARSFVVALLRAVHAFPDPPDTPIGVLARSIWACVGRQPEEQDVPFSLFSTAAVCQCLSQRARIWLWLRHHVLTDARDDVEGTAGAILPADGGASGRNVHTQHLLAYWNDPIPHPSFTFTRGGRTISQEQLLLQQCCQGNDLDWLGLSRTWAKFPHSQGFALQLLQRYEQPLKLLLCFTPKSMYSVLGHLSPAAVSTLKPVAETLFGSWIQTILSQLYEVRSPSIDMVALQRRIVMFKWICILNGVMGLKRDDSDVGIPFGQEDVCHLLHCDIRLELPGTRASSLAANDDASGSPHNVKHATVSILRQLMRLDGPPNVLISQSKICAALLQLSPQDLAAQDTFGRAFVDFILHPQIRSRGSGPVVAHEGIESASECTSVWQWLDEASPSSHSDLSAVVHRLSPAALSRLLETTFDPSQAVVLFDALWASNVSEATMRSIVDDAAASTRLSRRQLLRFIQCMVEKGMGRGWEAHESFMNAIRAASSGADASTVDDDGAPIDPCLVLEDALHCDPILHYVCKNLSDAVVGFPHGDWMPYAAKLLHLPEHLPEALMFQLKSQQQQSSEDMRFLLMSLWMLVPQHPLPMFERDPSLDVLRRLAQALQLAQRITRQPHLASSGAKFICCPEYLSALEYKAFCERFRCESRIRRITCLVTTQGNERPYNVNVTLRPIPEKFVAKVKATLEDASAFETCRAASATTAALSSFRLQALLCLGKGLSEDSIDRNLACLHHCRPGGWKPNSAVAQERADMVKDTSFFIVMVILAWFRSFGVEQGTVKQWMDTLELNAAAVHAFNPSRANEFCNKYTLIPIPSFFNVAVTTDSLTVGAADTPILFGQRWTDVLYTQQMLLAFVSPISQHPNYLQLRNLWSLRPGDVRVHLGHVNKEHYKESTLVVKACQTLGQHLADEKSPPSEEALVAFAQCVRAAPKDVVTLMFKSVFEMLSRHKSAKHVAEAMHRLLMQFMGSNNILLLALEKVMTYELAVPEGLKQELVWLVKEGFLVMGSSPIKSLTDLRVVAVDGHTNGPGFDAVWSWNPQPYGGDADSADSKSAHDDASDDPPYTEGSGSAKLVEKETTPFFIEQDAGVASGGSNDVAARSSAFLDPPRRFKTSESDVEFIDVSMLMEVVVYDGCYAVLRLRPGSAGFLVLNLEENHGMLEAAPGKERGKGTVSAYIPAERFDELVGTTQLRKGTTFRTIPMGDPYKAWAYLCSASVDVGSVLMVRAPPSLRAEAAGDAEAVPSMFLRKSDGAQWEPVLPAACGGDSMRVPLYAWLKLHDKLGVPMESGIVALLKDMVELLEQRHGPEAARRAEDGYMVDEDQLKQCVLEAFIAYTREEDIDESGLIPWSRDDPAMVSRRRQLKRLLQSVSHIELACELLSGNDVYNYGEKCFGKRVMAGAAAFLQLCDPTAPKRNTIECKTTCIVGPDVPVTFHLLPRGASSMVTNRGFAKPLGYFMDDHLTHLHEHVDVASRWVLRVLRSPLSEECKRWFVQLLRLGKDDFSCRLPPTVLQHRQRARRLRGKAKDQWATSIVGHCLAHVCPSSSGRPEWLAVRRVLIGAWPIPVCLSPYVERVDFKYGIYFCNSHTLFDMQRLGLRVEVVDLKSMADLDSASCDLLYLRIIEKFQPFVCFVYVKGLAGIEDRLLKWCAEYTEQWPWRFIYFENTDSSFNFSENRDRCNRRFFHAPTFTEWRYGATASKMEVYEVTYRNQMAMDVDDASDPLCVAGAYDWVTRGKDTFWTRERGEESRWLSDWKPKVEEHLGQPGGSILLLVSAPGAGKTHFMENDVLRLLEGCTVRRLDCSSDTLVNSVISQCLDELFPETLQKGLLVADEFHMLTVDQKQELLAWASAHIAWLKVVLVANRSTNEDEEMMRTVSASGKSETICARLALRSIEEVHCRSVTSTVKRFTLLWHQAARALFGNEAITLRNVVDLQTHCRAHQGVASQTGLAKVLLRKMPMLGLFTCSAFANFFLQLLEENGERPVGATPEDAEPMKLLIRAAMLPDVEQLPSYPEFVDMLGAGHHVHPTVRLATWVCMLYSNHGRPTPPTKALLRLHMIDYVGFPFLLGASAQRSAVPSVCSAFARPGDYRDLEWMRDSLSRGYAMNWEQVKRTWAVQAVTSPSEFCNLLDSCPDRSACLLALSPDNLCHLVESVGTMHFARQVSECVPFKEHAYGAEFEPYLAAQWFLIRSPDMGATFLNEAFRSHPTRLRNTLLWASLHCTERRTVAGEAERLQAELFKLLVHVSTDLWHSLLHSAARDKMSCEAANMLVTLWSSAFANLLRFGGKAVPWDVAMLLAMRTPPSPFIAAWPRELQALCHVVHCQGDLEHLEQLTDVPLCTDDGITCDATTSPWAEFAQAVAVGLLKLPSNHRLPTRWQYRLLLTKGLYVNRAPAHTLHQFDEVLRVPTCKILLSEGCPFRRQLEERMLFLRPQGDRLPMDSETGDGVAKREKAQLTRRMRFLKRIVPLKGPVDPSKPPPILHFYNDVIGATSEERQAEGSGEDPKKGINPKGPHYALGRAGAFDSFSLLIGFFYSTKGDSGFTADDMERFRRDALAALEPLGLRVVIVDAMSDDNVEATFCRLLLDPKESFDCAWVVSSHAREWSDRVGDKNPVQKWRDLASACERFHCSGRGLFIFAENEPFFDHANVILERICQTGPNFLTGNDDIESGQLRIRTSGAKEASQFEYHLATASLVALYGGDSLSWPDPSKIGLSPLNVLARSCMNKPCWLYGSCKDDHFQPGKLESGRGRIMVDTGFTKLWLNWNKGDTKSFICNATVWLLGIDYRLCRDAEEKLPSLQSRSFTASSNSPVESPAMSVGSAKVDLIFVLDTSGSVGSGMWNDLCTFLRTAVSELQGCGDCYYGVVLFDSYASTSYNLCGNSQELIRQAGNPTAFRQGRRGGTMFVPALQAAEGEFNARGRDGARRIIFFETDGCSGDQPGAEAEARRMRGAGTQIIGVGVGGDADRNALLGLSGDPLLVWMASDSGKMASLVGELVAVVSARSSGKQ